MFMNNVIILLLAVRICEDSDKRGSDKRGYTVLDILFCAMGMHGGLKDTVFYPPIFWLIYEL